MSTRTVRGRTTYYRGTRMRSRLEARVAAMFDRGGLPWEYEPACFADATGQYLPDFRVHPPSTIADLQYYVEVKPATADRELAQRKMEIVLSTHPHAWLEVLMCDDRRAQVWTSSPIARAWDTYGSLDLGPAS